MENQTLNTVVKTVLFHGYSCTSIWNVWGVSKNSGNLQSDGHKNFENLLRNVWDNGTQSWQP